MAKRRRIVPDNSVMMPAFFHERIEFRGNPFDLSHRAKPPVDAIRMHRVDAHAPDLLMYEFMRRAHEKTSVRKGGAGLDAAAVERQILDFLRLSQEIRYQPATELVEDAWNLMLNRQIPPPDSWYLACARYWDAELWISSGEQRDHFAQHARKVYRNVHLLTEERFA